MAGCLMLKLAGLAIIGFPWLAESAIQLTQSFSYAIAPASQLNAFAYILPSFASGAIVFGSLLP